MIIEAFPYYKQDTNYSCGAASLQMILKHFGIVESERNLIKDLEIDHEDGMSHGPLITKIESLGLHYHIGKEANLGDVESFVEKGQPVLVEYIEPSNNEGHYAVMIGHDRGHVTLNDPWNGEHFKLKKSDFVKRWHDESGKFTRWYMVVYR